MVVEEPIVMGWVDTLRERIGFDYFYIDPMQTMLIDWTTAGLHCYRDADIDEYHGWSWQGACDFTVSIPENAHEIATPYPNPGTSSFTLQLPGGMHTIEVFDATGRRVLSERTTDANVRVDTEEIPAGLYHVRVMDALGPTQNARWIKQ